MKLGKTIRLAFTIGCLIATSASTCAWSATPGAAPAVTEASIMKDLGLLENRFFSRQFANDPTDKRLERLELLVFGATQDGDLASRWTKLNKTIVSRPAQAAASKGSADPMAPVEKAAPADGSSQYPVLNTLEWRALKKTFPNESIDQRLGRIEKKLFGQDAPGMAYVDRVDRLKKTLGVGVTAAVPTGPVGPPPRARGRGLPGTNLDSFVAPFGGGGNVYGDEGTFGGNDSFMSPFGFGFGNSAINGTFNQLFADMQRQMSQVERLGPGTWVLDPKTGMFVEQGSGRRVKPDGTPAPGGAITPPSSAVKPRSLAPSPKQNGQQFHFQFPLGGGSGGGLGGGSDDSKLPPYADPNSI